MLRSRSAPPTLHLFSTCAPPLSHPVLPHAHRVNWFCSLKGNEFFVEVDEDFIQDDFNLTGLSVQVPYYEYALDTILDVETPREAGLSEDQQDSIEAAAELLYGLIHARYIITPRGTAGMLEKFKGIHFGRCPRVFCQGQPVLPVGQSDIPRTHTCKLFCPKCEDIFYPRSGRHANIDGACPPPVADAAPQAHTHTHTTLTPTPTPILPSHTLTHHIPHPHTHPTLPSTPNPPPYPSPLPPPPPKRRLLWHHLLPPLHANLLGPQADAAA